MSRSKEKQIRMLDFDFEDVLKEHFPLKLTMKERMEIAKLAARHFNHYKYERKMIKISQEKEHLEEVLSRKKKRLREYEDAIIRRNEVIAEYTHCECDECIHNCRSWCDISHHGWCDKKYGETDVQTDRRLAQEYMKLKRKLDKEEE